MLVYHLSLPLHQLERSLHLYHLARRVRIVVRLIDLCSDGNSVTFYSSCSAIIESLRVFEITRSSTIPLKIKPNLHVHNSMLANYVGNW